MRPEIAVEVENVSHHYGARRALDDVSFHVHQREIFCFLGPNGGGKTTLFRLLSTLIPLEQGSIRLLGHDVTREVTAVRAEIGVVFQAASLDRKLTVKENLRHQGRLYGLTGRLLEDRMQEMLARLHLTDRAKDLVETLSGGLRRRAELAKGMLHRPRLLLMDEPSTGLDPAARSDLWEYLREIREQDGVTVALTTHLLEEADKADRLGILNQGSLVALDSPANLRSEVGGDAITIETDDPATLSEAVNARFDGHAKVVDGSVRLEQPEGHRLISRLCDAFPGRIRSITVGRPTLEDVFIARTGHGFREARDN